MRKSGLLAGTIGGACGVAAMSLFIKAATRGRTMNPQESKTTLDPRSKPAARVEESSTAKIARLAVEETTGRQPSAGMKRKLSNAAHLAYGVAIGTLYLGLAGLRRPDPLAAGTAYGLAVWVVGDEIMLPKLGLWYPPQSRSARSHLQLAAAHVVYGSVLGLTTALIAKD